jgi:hypothetical protein
LAHFFVIAFKISGEIQISIHLKQLYYETEIIDNAHRYRGVWGNFMCEFKKIFKDAGGAPKGPGCHEYPIERM